MHSWRWSIRPPGSFMKFFASSPNARAAARAWNSLQSFVRHAPSNSIICRQLKLFCLLAHFFQNQLFYFIRFCFYVCFWTMERAPVTDLQKVMQNYNLDICNCICLQLLNIVTGTKWKGDVEKYACSAILIADSLTTSDDIIYSDSEFRLELGANVSGQVKSQARVQTSRV